MVAFFKFCNICEKNQKLPQNGLWNDSQMRKIPAGSLPKAMPKINLKMNTTKNAFESDFRTKLLQKSSGKKHSRINFLKPFWDPSSKPLQEAPWTSQIMTKSRKNQDFSNIVHAILHLLQHAFCPAFASGCWKCAHSTRRWWGRMFGGAAMTRRRRLR